MSNKSISQKLSIKPGNKFLLVNPPDGYLARMGEMPPGAIILNDCNCQVEAIQVFIENQVELEEQLPRLKELMVPKGMIWVTYHKGTSKIKTNVNRDTINAYAKSIGLVGIAMISINDDWSALRLKQE